MDQLNVVLTLCSAASLDIRYVAIRKVGMHDISAMIDLDFV